MYKKQLGFQKIICMICVIAAAVSFVYSLGIMTDIYDSLYSTMMDPNDLTQTFVPGSIIYYDMQDFNKLFMVLSIGLLLSAALLYRIEAGRRICRKSGWYQFYFTLLQTNLQGLFA